MVRYLVQAEAQLQNLKNTCHIQATTTPNSLPESSSEEYVWLVGKIIDREQFNCNQDNIGFVGIVGFDRQQKQFVLLQIATAEAEDDSVTNLSKREQEVLQLVVKGCSNAQIARILVISQNTVKVHLRNIFEKLKVQSRTEAAMYAVRQGWVALDSVV